MSTMPQLPRAVALPAAVAVLVWSGGADRIFEPAPARAAESALRADAAALEGATASVRWNAITRDFISAKTGAAKPNQQAALRAFAYLSLAQYRAVVAADAARDRPPRASPQGAVAAASAVLLSALFPADAAFFESQLRLQEREVAGSKNARRAFAAGEIIGRPVAAEVVGLARSDHFDSVWTGTMPTGSGYWSSDVDPPRPPLLPLLGQMRPFFMASGDQFRPDPPPAYESDEFRKALAEVRHLADTRTAKQKQIAEFWSMTTGSLVAGFWNEEASKLVVRYHLNERRAAYALALTQMAAMDANIACHDAKYMYWLIRPYKADPAITSPIARPNHPSYPSNHACLSGAAAYVLGALFPRDAARLAAMADEAGESRLYAGFHYRFDKDAGLRIARQVADLALSRGVDDAHEWPGIRRAPAPQDARTVEPRR